MRSSNLSNAKSRHPCVAVMGALCDQIQDLARLPDDDAEALGLVVPTELCLELGTPALIRLAESQGIAARPSREMVTR